MKAYKMHVCDRDTDWWEEPRRLKNCDSLQEAQEIAADIVDRFNRTLRIGESQRALLDVQKILEVQQETEDDF